MKRAVGIPVIGTVSGADAKVEFTMDRCDSCGQVSVMFTRSAVDYLRQRLNYLHITGNLTTDNTEAIVVGLILKAILTDTVDVFIDASVLGVK